MAFKHDSKQEGKSEADKLAKTGKEKLWLSNKVNITTIQANVKFQVITLKEDNLRKLIRIKPEMGKERLNNENSKKRRGN